MAFTVHSALLDNLTGRVTALPMVLTDESTNEQGKKYMCEHKCLYNWMLCKFYVCKRTEFLCFLSITKFELWVAGRFVAFFFFFKWICCDAIFFFLFCQEWVWKVSFLWSACSRPSNWHLVLLSECMIKDKTDCNRGNSMIWIIIWIWSQALNSMTLVGPLQLGVFCDSMINRMCTSCVSACRKKQATESSCMCVITFCNSSSTGKGAYIRLRAGQNV